MTETVGRKAGAVGGDELRQVTELLGGAAVLRHPPRTPLDAHEMLSRGLPGKALFHLVDRLTVIKASGSFEAALGMSQRTFQRVRKAPSKPLRREQSGRAWKFAEILAKATEVLGSQEEAERWLDSPQMALDRRRPIDLLATPAGVELVEDLLERLEYGVYT